MARSRMKCFLAGMLEPRVNKRLTAEVGFLQLAGADIRWVPEANRHITMRFIGELESEDIMPVVEATHRAVEEIPACKPIVSRLVSFPPWSQETPPRVIAASVSGDIEPLDDLYNALQDQLAAVGIRREKKGYSPHVTLGRVRAHRCMDELLDRLGRGRRREFGATALNKIQLMMSTRGERGPEYTVMNEFPLNG